MTKDVRYGIVRRVALAFGDADARLRHALEQEGFGVLTEIDVRATLKKKLNVEIPQYRILGACNPELAHQAIQAEPDVGLLLPCNLVLREDDGVIVVEALDPVVQLEVAGNPALMKLARDVRTRLERAIDTLPAAFGV